MFQLRCRQCLKSQNHRIIPSDLEETHKDHRVQLLNEWILPWCLFWVTTINTAYIKSGIFSPCVHWGFFLTLYLTSHFLTLTFSHLVICTGSVFLITDWNQSHWSKISWLSLSLFKNWYCFCYFPVICINTILRNRNTAGHLKSATSNLLKSHGLDKETLILSSVH